MSEVSSEAVEAAARAAFDADNDSQWTWETLPEYEKPDFRRAARAALTAALPYLSPSVAPSAEEVRDELSGWPIGSGYYATQVGTDEARDMAEAVLALFASQPTVAELEQIRAERDAAQEHLRYHLADFRPLADGNMSGDLAVDIAAYASRLQADLEEARAALASQPTVAQVRGQVAREIEAAGHDDDRWLRTCDDYRAAGWEGDPDDYERMFWAAAHNDAARIARTETKGGE